MKRFIGILFSAITLIAQTEINDRSGNGTGIYHLNGQIGVGTSSPEGNLQIGSGTQHGMLFLGGGKGYSGIGSTRSDGGLILGKNIYSRYGDAAYNSNAYVGQTNGVGFSGAKFGQNGEIYFFGKHGNVTKNEQANHVDNIRLYIKSDGNVGIGETNPQYSLHIDKKQDHSRIGLFGKVSSQILFYEKNSSYTEAMRLLRYNDVLSLTYGENANEEALNITKTGNVGIGTTDPKTRLHIRGNGSPNGLFFEHGTSTGYGFKLYQEKKNGSAVESFHIGFQHPSNGLKDIISYNELGNVGIGTTDPAGYKLSVNGTGFFNGNITADKIRINSFVSYGRNGSYAEIISGGNELRLGGTTGAMHINYAQASEKGTPSSYVWHNGTPAGLADFKVGNLTASGSIPFTSDRGTVSGGFVWQDYKANSSLRWRLRSDVTNYQYELQSGNGTNVFALQQNGDLKITGNFVAAGANGIVAKKIKVTSTAGADFVFEDDYDLKPLEEVESFIKENKHLPEIPSAKDMKENGLDMSEFQIKLLQKIEELTLHSIAMKKQLQSHEQQNKEQNKLITKLLNENILLKKKLN